jgi:FKBP-type peptidyl-prolyl cis-trans isomerase SlyD
MNVFANTVVSLTFKLFDARDTLIEEAREPITYLHGGYSGIFPRVEEALMHKKGGESVSVTREPVDAFGDYDASMVRMEPVDALPPDLSVGGYVVS